MAFAYVSVSHALFYYFIAYLILLQNVYPTTSQVF